MFSDISSQVPVQGHCIHRSLGMSTRGKFEYLVLHLQCVKCKRMITILSHDQETNKNVAGFMSTWTEQMGYPVITITTQTGEISQEQFLLKQTEGHG